MKNVIIKTVIIAAAATLAACSNTPKTVPLGDGDKLVWTSHDDKPQWAVKSTLDTTERELNGQPTTVYGFTGLSYRHKSERIAKEVAVTDAIAKASAFVQQEAEKEMETYYESLSREDRGTSGTISIKERTKTFAKNYISAASVQDIYLERWDVPEGYIFKAYARIEIPERQMKRAMSLANEKALNEIAPIQPISPTTQTSREENAQPTVPPQNDVVSNIVTQAL